MKYSLLAALLLLSSVAHSTPREIPTCASLNQKTLYNVRSWGGNWGQADCWGGDLVGRSYVSRNKTMEVKWNDSRRLCVVLKGEYLGTAVSSMVARIGINLSGRWVTMVKGKIEEGDEVMLRLASTRTASPSSSATWRPRSA